MLVCIAWFLAAGRSRALPLFTIVARHVLGARGRGGPKRFGSFPFHSRAHRTRGLTVDQAATFSLVLCLAPLASHRSTSSSAYQTRLEPGGWK